MDWTPEKLNEYIQKFDVTAREIAHELNISDRRIYLIRNGDIKIGQFGEMLTAYFDSLKSAKIVFHEKMISHYQNIITH